MNSPLHTTLCDKLGIEYPVVAFTHCKDVAVAVINSGGFAVLGEALHTPDEIAADIKWIRERIGGNLAQVFEKIAASILVVPSVAVSSPVAVTVFSLPEAVVMKTLSALFT